MKSLAAFVLLLISCCSCDQQTCDIDGNEPERVANYEEILALPGKPEVLLIDVRQPEELEREGKIPTAINIPLREVTEVLKNTTPQEFKNKYGRDKPNMDTEIIFTCRSGNRAKEAMEMALKLCYNKARYYKGSFTEWASKQKKQ